MIENSSLNTPISIKMKYGIFFKTARKQCGYTQKEVADKLSIHQSNVSFLILCSSAQNIYANVKKVCQFPAFYYARLVNPLLPT